MTANPSAPDLSRTIAGILSQWGRLRILDLTALLEERGWDVGPDEVRAHPAPLSSRARGVALMAAEVGAPPGPGHPAAWCRPAWADDPLGRGTEEAAALAEVSCWTVGRYVRAGIVLPRSEKRDALG